MLKSGAPEYFPLARKKVRDIYGNWVWKDFDVAKGKEEDPEKAPDAASLELRKSKREDSKNADDDHRDYESLRLEWRDYIAISIASLETFLLPLVVIVLIISGLVFVLSFFR